MKVCVTLRAAILAIHDGYHIADCEDLCMEDRCGEWDAKRECCGRIGSELTADTHVARHLLQVLVAVKQELVFGGNFEDATHLADEAIAKYTTLLKER